MPRRRSPLGAAVVSEAKRDALALTRMGEKKLKA
jgi:hypothetical protein